MEIQPTSVSWSVETDNKHMALKVVSLHKPREIWNESNWNNTTRYVHTRVFVTPAVRQVEITVAHFILVPLVHLDYNYCGDAKVKNLPMSFQMSTTYCLNFTVFYPTNMHH